jgi:hypothetical protein
VGFGEARSEMLSRIVDPAGILNFDLAIRRLKSGAEAALGFNPRRGP